LNGGFLRKRQGLARLLRRGYLSGGFFERGRAWRVFKTGHLNGGFLRKRKGLAGLLRRGYLSGGFFEKGRAWPGF